MSMFRKTPLKPKTSLKDLGKLKLLSQTSTRRHPLRRKAPLCIEAIAVTCGGNLSMQLRDFVRQVQFYHPSWPLHIATDLQGYESINDLVRPCDTVWQVKREEMEQYGASKAVEHLEGKRWSKLWIGVKLENLRRAVSKYQKGVLLCDSDFVFTRGLERINWQADVVMSTHHGHIVDHGIPPEHGTFNAGLLLTDKLAIVERWIDMYQRGVGGFYEQKLMENLSEKYVVSLFPSDWNWGTWRVAEDIAISGRIPPIIHAHVTGPYVLEGNSVTKIGRERMNINRRSFGTHPRYAFYHCSKSAGTAMMQALCTIAEEQVQYQVLNGFDVGPCDWTEQDLMQICYEAHRYQVGNRFIVHNHGQNWSDKAINAYLDNDWRFFALYRPIRDRLCSFYFWSINVLQKKGLHPMSGAITKAPTIEDFLMTLATNPVYFDEWALPTRHQEFIWYPANAEGIRRACKQLFNSTLSRDIKNNTSPNPGWQQCLEDGRISQATADIINNLTMVQEWDTFIAKQEEEHGKTRSTF